MSFFPRAAASLLCLAVFGGTPSVLAEPGAAEPGPAELVDALNDVFGQYPHTRAGHAKGVCVTGRFTPSEEAASLSKAPQFAEPASVIGRFSMGGGNPKAPDNAKGNVRGLALRFDLGDGANTDLAMISAPVFAAKSPRSFFDLLTARASGDADKVEAFFAANPDSRHQGQWLNARPVPASYAGVNYWGVHAFTLENAEGKETLAKFKVVPAGGEEGLSDEEAEAAGDDFLIGELKERLGNGPAEFDLFAIIGEEGDPTDDATAFWDEDNREKTELGRVSIEGIAPDAICDAFTFLPSNLTQGIAGPENDPIFLIRSPAYVVSFTKAGGAVGPKALNDARR